MTQAEALFKECAASEVTEAVYLRAKQSAKGLSSKLSSWADVVHFSGVHDKLKVMVNMV